MKNRYGSADELLYDLEFYIYSGGYGPTNETLGKFVRNLFGLDPAVATRDAKGSTRLLERTARITRTTTKSSRTTRSARNTNHTRNSKKSSRVV